MDMYLTFLPPAPPTDDDPAPATGPIAPALAA